MSMSVCSKCSKPGDFRPGHRQCRDCERAAGRASYADRKEQAVAYRETHRDHYRKLNVENQRRKKAKRHIELDRIKSVPCKDCGQTFAPYVMDFDHRDPSAKAHEVSQLINKTAAPWTRILEEVTKCDVVCVCCHRMRGWKPPKILDSRKRLLISLKSKPCLDCGRVFHYCQMDFDHVRGVKVAGVHDLKSRAAILAEVEKCDLVCANCHRVRTQALPKGETRSQIPAEDLFRARAKPSKRPKAYRSWHDLAGTMPDNAVAKQFHISIPSICLYRKSQGIPSYRASGGVLPETPGVPTGTAPLRELLKAEAQSVASVLGSVEQHASKPGLKPRTILLQELAGTAPDHIIAAQLGMLPSKVGGYRKKHRIEGFKKSVDDVVHPWHLLAGKMSDLNIERLYGVPRNTVKFYRDKLGIPVFQKYLRIHPEQAREACLNNDLMKMEKVAS